MRLPVIILLSALIVIGCAKIHKTKDTTSLQLEIIEDEVIYYDSDTLRLNLKLTNDGTRPVTVATPHSLFTLVSVPVYDKFTVYRTLWFAGIKDDKGSDGRLKTLNPGDSEPFPTGFVALMSTTNYPELNLIAAYYVTVEIDSTSTEYEIWSSDSIRIITEQ